MTIGQTNIKLSTVLEHALRRAGIPPEAQTPEIVSTAKTNLFFILNNFSNRGMTYWCVNEEFLTLTEGGVRNEMPAGTIDILNANYRKMTTISGTDTLAATSMTRVFAETTTIQMFKIAVPFVGTITVSTSDDDVTYTTRSTHTHDGTTKWYAVDPAVSALYFRISVSAGSFVPTELVTVSGYIDVPMFRMNRDQYAMMTNKHTKDNPLQYWFDRQISPAMMLWPAPSSAATANCVHVFRNHQIADVGSLTSSVEIPNRWHEATVWALAQNMAVELPNTPPDRIRMCIDMAEKSLNEVQIEERDNSVIEFTPNIGVYNA
jgi:hypothetical protein